MKSPLEKEIEDLTNEVATGIMLADKSRLLPAVPGLNKIRLHALGMYMLLAIESGKHDDEIGLIIARCLKAAYYLRR